MNVKNKIILALISFVSTSVFAQNNVSNNFEASANIKDFCQIQSNDINFGVVALPLTAQNANTQMNIRCTNSTPYKIDLEYGGNTLGNSVNMDYTIQFSTSTSNYGVNNFNRYRVHNKSGNLLGYLDCPLHESKYGMVQFTHGAVASVYGYPADTPFSWITDTKQTCTQNIPTGWAGEYNVPGTQPINGEPKKAEYGSMKGTFKADKLAYQITLPEDSSKPWIANVNSLNSLGNGEVQIIQMNARIIPDKSSSNYIAADTYLDTVIATVTY